jgi:hypothetical protein
MSKRQELRTVEQEIERLNAMREKLLNSPDLKKEMEFEGKLRELMVKYDVSLKDVIRLIDPVTSGKAPVGKSGRAPRELKTYRNPHTKEVVQTKGGNHKTLKEWKAKWGADAVKSWVQ